MSDETPMQENITTIRYAGAEQFVGESVSGHSVIADFRHDNQSAPSPMELLLISLGGCTGADVVNILQKKRQRITDYQIEIRAQRRDEHPRIYTSIEVLHKVRGFNVDEKAVARAIELSESKYCSVSAMLAASAKITARFEVTQEVTTQ
ncbi:MAG: OsmC family protein [Acidobacteriota bacterium]